MRNPNPEPVDLDGFVLMDDAALDTLGALSLGNLPSHVIPPYGHAVLVNADLEGIAEFAAAWNIPEDQVVRIAGACP